MIDGPVLDQSSLVETNIIPDDYKPGLLCSVLYNCIQKCDYVLYCRDLERDLQAAHMLIFPPPLPRRQSQRLFVP